MSLYALLAKRFKRPALYSVAGARAWFCAVSLAYFLRRLATLVPLVLVISFLAFCLVRVAPGGPFDKERAPATPDIERNLKAKYHLDEPLWKQYLRFIGIGFEKRNDEWRAFKGGLVRGNFGPSLKYRNHSVNDIIAQGLPVSLSLGILSFCFALGFGIPLGVWTAVRRGRWQDHVGSFFFHSRGVHTGVCAGAGADCVAGDQVAGIPSGTLGWTVACDLAGDRARHLLRRESFAVDSRGDEPGVAFGLHHHRARQGVE